jgi:hypothetical protein
VIDAGVETVIDAGVDTVIDVGTGGRMDGEI